MKNLTKPAILAAITALFVWLPIQAQAQPGGGGRGNFDPEQMRQRMMERYKDMLEIQSDDEWKAIEPRVQKVNEARREVGFGGAMRGGAMFGAQRRQGGGDQATQGQAPAQRRRNADAQGSAAAQELQKAIESKASAETIKTKLAAFRAERKAKEADLAKAQDDLRKVLTVRQEAMAVMGGLLE